MSERKREISEGVAAVTHDLQNALQAISHQAELLAGEDQSAPVAARTELILKSVNASSAMVRRLSGLARVADAAPERPIDLNALLQDVAALTDGGSRRGVSVELDLGDVPCVGGDATELLRVFSNLLVNAYEAVGPGGHIRITTRTNRLRVLATISDDGPGMTAATRRQIFCRSFTTKGGSDRGLGLSIVAELLRRQHGHVLVRSTPGKGATFSVSLRPWRAHAAHTQLPPGLDELAALREVA